MVVNPCQVSQAGIQLCVTRGIGIVSSSSVVKITGNSTGKLNSKRLENRMAIRDRKLNNSQLLLKIFKISSWPR